MPTVPGTTRIYCDHCSKTHYMTPDAMRTAILAFQAGDLQTVGKTGVTALCVRSGEVTQAA